MEIDISKEKEFFPTIDTGTGTTNSFKLNLIIQRFHYTINYYQLTLRYYKAISRQIKLKNYNRLLGTGKKS